jgi:hypothetical protein
MSCTEHVWQPFWTERLGPDSKSCLDCGEVRHVSNDRLLRHPMLQDHPAWQALLRAPLDPNPYTNEERAEIKHRLADSFETADLFPFPYVGITVSEVEIPCSGPCGTSTTDCEIADIAWLCACCSGSIDMLWNPASSSGWKRGFNSRVASAWDRHVRADSDAYRRWAASVAMLLEHCNARLNPRLLKREDITQCGAEAMR